MIGAIPRRGRDSNKFAARQRARLRRLARADRRAVPGASESAMRAGAGYVTAFVPASLNLVFETRLLEVMTVPLPDRDGAAAAGRRRHGRSGTRAGPDALVLGPGLGRESGSVELVPRAGARRPRSRCCSTPTGSTPTRSGWSRSPVARRADRAHAARGRARAPARGRRGEIERSRLASRAAGGLAGGRRGRAEGRRHDRRRPRRERRRSAAAARRRWRRREPAMSCRA